MDFSFVVNSVYSLIWNAGSEADEESDATE